MENVLNELTSKPAHLKHVEVEHDASKPAIEPGAWVERPLGLEGREKRGPFRARAPIGAARAPIGASASPRRPLTGRAHEPSAARAVPDARSRPIAPDRPLPGTGVGKWDKDALLQGIQQGEARCGAWLGAGSARAPRAVAPSLQRERRGACCARARRPCANPLRRCAPPLC